MALYKARKGNGMFYIQPEMVEGYAALGYEIIRVEDVAVTDIQKEVEKIKEIAGGDANGQG